MCSASCWSCWCRREAMKNASLPLRVSTPCSTHMPGTQKQTQSAVQDKDSHMCLEFHCEQCSVASTCPKVMRLLQAVLGPGIWLPPSLRPHSLIRPSSQADSVQAAPTSPDWPAHGPPQYPHHPQPGPPPRHHRHLTQLYLAHTAHGRSVSATEAAQSDHHRCRRPQQCCCHCCCCAWQALTGADLSRTARLIQQQQRRLVLSRGQCCCVASVWWGRRVGAGSGLLCCAWRVSCCCAGWAPLLPSLGQA